MRYPSIDSFTFTDHGREFTAEITQDDIGPPWENEDGHGPVSKWQTLYRHRNGVSKSPGDRILCRDGNSYRVYDMQAATKLAWKEGWGLGEKALVELSTKLGRKPKRSDIVREAVERDFQWLRAWCNNEWCYVVVHVTDVETGDDDYLGGVESDGDYWKECAREMASNMHPLAEAHEAANLELCTD